MVAAQKYRTAAAIAGNINHGGGGQGHLAPQHVDRSSGARAAIAETGTLILWPDANEPRLMSLVPPVHIVLLDATRIYNTFFEAMTAEGWKDGLPTNALLISGPSKTADIQQTLAYGAHGPKELVVLMLNSEEVAQ